MFTCSSNPQDIHSAVDRRGTIVVAVAVVVLFVTTAVAVGITLVDSGLKFFNAFNNLRQGQALGSVIVKQQPIRAEVQVWSPRRRPAHLASSAQRKARVTLTAEAEVTPRRAVA